MVNARRCPICQRLLGAECFRLLQTGKRDTYCMPCRRDYARQSARDRYRASPEVRLRAMAARKARDAKRAAEQAEERGWRMDFAASAVTRLNGYGLDHSVVARRLGVNVGTVYAWTARRQLPRAEVVTALARLLAAEEARWKTGRR